MSELSVPACWNVAGVDDKRHQRAWDQNLYRCRTNLSTAADCWKTKTTAKETTHWPAEGERVQQLQVRWSTGEKTTGKQINFVLTVDYQLIINASSWIYFFNFCPKVSVEVKFFAFCLCLCLWWSAGRTWWQVAWWNTLTLWRRRRWCLPWPQMTSRRRVWPTAQPTHIVRSTPPWSLESVLPSFPSPTTTRYNKIQKQKSS